MQLGSILVRDRETVIVNASDGRAATLPDCFAAAGSGTGPDTVQAIIEIEELGRLSKPIVHTGSAS